MSNNLSGLLYEHSQLKQKLDDSIIGGDMDLNSKLEKSRAELERRIFFARTADYRERLAELESEQRAANDLRGDFQADFQQAAENVMDARQRAIDSQKIHAQLSLRLGVLDNTIKQNRETINELKAELAAHLKQKLYGGNDND